MIIWDMIDKEIVPLKILRLGQGSKLLPKGWRRSYAVNNTLLVQEGNTTQDGMYERYHVIKRREPSIERFLSPSTRSSSSL